MEIAGYDPCRGKPGGVSHRLGSAIPVADQDADADDDPGRPLADTH